MRIPIVHYNNPNVKEKLVDSIRKTGFAVLTGTFVEPELIKTVYGDFKNLFDSKESRAALLFNKETQEGYFPMKSEKAKDATLGDLKEFFHYYPNRQTGHFASRATRELCLQLEDLAIEVLGWLEDAYNKANATKSAAHPGLDISGWGAKVEDSTSTLFRVLHYPPLRDTDEVGAVRSAAHEDINFITLLPAATDSGLQVKDRDGNWVDLVTDANSIIVNIGDMLALMTDNFYPSTTHRVVNPTTENRSRYSMPLFLHPHADTQLSPTKTAHQYLMERLKELGLI